MKMIDHLPFKAVSSLFHQAMATRPPLLPQDVGQLLEVALLQHESFRAVLLADPPVERLKEAAALQFHIFAALGDLYARPLFSVPQGSTIAAGLLYAEMIRRLLTRTRQDERFASRSAREYLQPLSGSFRRLSQALHEELSDVSSLPALQQQCADYMNGVAFVLYQLESLHGRTSVLRTGAESSAHESLGDAEESSIRGPPWAPQSAGIAVTQRRLLCEPLCT